MRAMELSETSNEKRKKKGQKIPTKKQIQIIKKFRNTHHM